MYVYCVLWRVVEVHIAWRALAHTHRQRHGTAHTVSTIFSFSFRGPLRPQTNQIQFEINGAASPSHPSISFLFLSFDLVWLFSFASYALVFDLLSVSCVCCRSGNSLEINKRDYFAVRFIIGQLRVYSLASVKRTRVSFSRSIAFIQDSKRFDAESQHRCFVVVVVFVERRHNRIVAFVRNHFVRVMGVWCACDASHINSIWHVRTNRGPMTKPTNNILSLSGPIAVALCCPLRFYSNK